MKKHINFPMAFDLDKNAVDIDTTFNTLHDLTGVFYNNTYSPVWTKKTEKTSSFVIDRNGDKYELKQLLGGSTLYKNDTPLFSVTGNRFSKTEYTPEHQYFTVVGNTEYGFDVDSLNRIDIDGALSGTLFTSGLVLAGRAFYHNSKTIAVVLYIDDSNIVNVAYFDGTNFEAHAFAWNRNKYQSSSNHPTPTTAVASDAEKVIYEPIIFISEHNDDIFVTVANNAGAQIEPDKFFTDSFIFHDNAFYKTISFSTTSIPKVIPVSEAISVNTTYSVNSIFNTFNCYSKNGNTFYSTKDDTTTPLTFDAGYSPSQTSSEPDVDGWSTYLYSVSTTTFNASLSPTTDVYDPYLNIDFTNSNVPKRDVEAVALVGGACTYTYIYNGQMSPENVTATITFDYYNNQQTVSQKTAVTVPFNRLGYTYTFQNEYTTTANVTAGVSPNVFSDDGFMYCLFDASNDTKCTAATGYTMPFKSHINTISYSGTAATISYIIDTAGEFDNTACVYRAASFGLGQSWARFNGTWTPKTLSEIVSNTGVLNALDVFWDSSLPTVKYGAGVNTSNVYRYQAVGENVDICQTANQLPFSRVGSRASISDNFNIIYLNELKVGLSYSQDENSMGTLISEWNDFSNNSYIIADNTSVYYQAGSNRWYRISTVIGNDISIVEDNYIIINTTSYWNCWDIEKQKKRHYASDYANRVVAGSTSKVYGEFYRGNVSVSATTLAGSGINANFLVTNDGLSSLSVGATPYARMTTGSESFIKCVTPNDADSEQIDIYYSNPSELNAIYKYSYNVFRYGLIRSTNSLLQGIYFPVSENAATLYNPNILTKYLLTYNNKDLVLNDNIGYQLSYASGTTPVLLFSTATQLENVQAIFVIQSQFYGIINNKLYSLLYSNGVLVESDCIIDINGLQFIGSLPTIAYFYSPTNRSFYCFTGDANLTLLYSATSIENVYATWYNTSTQTIYIGTNRGLFLISSLSMTRLPYYGVQNIYFTTSGEIFIETENDVIEISYYKEGHTEKPERLIFETKLFGTNEKENVNITSFHLTLLNNEYTDTDVVKYKVMTLTDKGTISPVEGSVSIKPDDWDILDQCSITINPSLTKGQGVSIYVDTPWAIANIVADVSTDRSTSTVVNRRQF